MGYSQHDPSIQGRAPWNVETVGTKRPLTQKHIWAIRFLLDRRAPYCADRVCNGTRVRAWKWRVPQYLGGRVRYFFNVAGAIDEPDQTGVEIASLSDARIRAVRFANEHLNDRPELVWLGEEFRVEVVDAKGRLLFTFVAVGVDAPAPEGRMRI